MEYIENNGRDTFLQLDGKRSWVHRIVNPLLTYLNRPGELQI